MKKNASRKHTAQVIHLAPAQSHYTGHYFKNVMPCQSCGAAEVREVQPMDEYEQTLRDEASRLASYARDEIDAGSVVEAAGMLRDAARLLDLWRQRARAREEEAG